MFALPPIPSWDGLHPLVVHFPIALLLVAPAFILLGLLRARNGKGFFLAALVLMVLGTAGTWIAVPTGEAAAELADRGAGVNAVLEQHEELAETTRTLFTVLTAIFALILSAPGLMRRAVRPRLALALYLPFLVFYAAGALVLANTAHAGGRLVHELGVRAAVAAPAPGGSAGPWLSSVGEDDD